MAKYSRLSSILLWIPLCVPHIFANSRFDQEKNYNELAQIIKKKFNEKVKNIEQLPSGNSKSKIFKIDTTHTLYLAKYIKPYQFSLLEEVQTIRLFAKHKVGPQILYADRGRNLVIMDFLQQKTIDINLRKSNELYINLAELLKTIHRIKPARWMKKYTLFDYITRDIKYLKQKGLPQKTAELISEIEKYCHAMKKEIRLEYTTCHNDLHPHNLILCEDRFYAIDGRATIGDPYYDLSTITIFWCFYPSAEEILLNAYFGRKPLCGEVEKYKKIKKLTQLAIAIDLLTMCVDIGKVVLNPGIKISLLEFFTTSDLDTEEKRIELASILVRDATKA